MAFRKSFLIHGGFALQREAQPREIDKQLVGRSQTFGTSGGEAAQRELGQLDGVILLSALLRCFQTPRW